MLMLSQAAEDRIVCFTAQEGGFALLIDLTTGALAGNPNINGETAANVAMEALDRLLVITKNSGPNG